MSSSIKLTNSSGKIVTITNPDTTSADVTVDLLNNAYTIATVNDFGTVPVGYTTVIVKDTDRGGVFNRIASTTANGGTIFSGTGYSWKRQYSGAVNVKWFQDNIQAAININGNIELNYGTIYTVTTPITYTGTVTIVGNNAKVVSDSIAFLITDGANSIIKDIEFDTISTPYTIIRTSLVPSTYTLQYSKEGYQPTVNDSDVWSGLTTAQKNQNIESGILFQASSVTQGNIKVSGIKGNFTSIILKDTNDSIVENCIIKAGKNFAGGILFWCLDSGIGAGRRNKAINNIVKYASYSGIVYAKQFDGIVTGNDCSFNGESGIKLWQGVTGNVDNKVARGMIISDNKCYFNYYDGIDAQGTYGTYDASVDMRNSISNNMSYYNRHTGITINGAYNKVDGNVVRANGTMGIIANYSTATNIINNQVYWNNTTGTATGVHQIQGAGINVVNNIVDKGSNAGYEVYMVTSGTYGHNILTNNSIYKDSNIATKGYSDYIYTPNGSTAFNVSDCNTVTRTGFYQAFGSAHLPDGNWYYLQVIGFGDNQPCVQIAYGFVGTTAYRRNYFDSAWTSWVAL